MVIYNSISLEIVLIWNYSYICWEKQVYLDEPGQSLDIECGGRDRQCTGGLPPTETLFSMTFPTLFSIYSGFRIPDYGFRFPVPDSGFRFSGFRVARDFAVQHQVCSLVEEQFRKYELTELGPSAVHLKD